MRRVTIMDTFASVAPPPDPSDGAGGASTPLRRARRGFLGAAAASALGALLVTRRSEAAPSSSVTPAIQSRWLALQETAAALKRVDSSAAELRAELVARYGEILGNWTNAKHWEGDPDRARLRHLIAESDRLGGIEADQLDDLLTCPAESIGDLSLKLSAVLGVWREKPKHFEEASEYHEDIALTFMQDAETFFGRGVAA
jgi:hypothetical protein